jgi:hypothetical protein
MNCYPEFRDYLESFADRYTRRTEYGSELTVEEEELQKLSDFLLKGIADYVVMKRSRDDGDSPELGEFLEHYADQYPRDSDVGAAFQVTKEEMVGLGLFCARGLVALFLRLDQNRGYFSGFGDVVGRNRSRRSGLFHRHLTARAL